MPRIALLSTSDTDLLSARASGADYVLANPGRASHQEMAEVETCDVVVARILGRPEDLCSGFRRIRDAGVPMVVVGGERTPSAELMEQSTSRRAARPTCASCTRSSPTRCCSPGRGSTRRSRCPTGACWTATGRVRCPSRPRWLRCPSR